MGNMPEEKITEVYEYAREARGATPNPGLGYLELGSTDLWTLRYLIN